MNMQLFSDIHIEIMNRIPYLPVRSKYLILAGDIGHKDNPYYLSFLKYVSENWEKVFYVLGNHEYYHLDIDETLNKYRKLLSNYNIILLENEYYDLEDFRIYGFTNWTNPDTYPKDDLNDYHSIDNITSEKIKRLSDTSLRRFNEFLQVNDRELIVVTHFPPINEKTSHPKYAKDRLRNYFSWKFHEVIPNENLRENIKVWCSGHTHHCYDFEKYGIRFISNQIGYRDDKQCPSDGLFSLSNGN